MPTVLRHGGYRFFFHSNEGSPREPPHVHVERDGRTAKVRLGTTAPLLDASGDGFSARELLAILRIVADHRAIMEDRWHEHFG